MTTIKITVEDEQADLLRKLLGEVSFITNMEREHVPGSNHYDPKPAHERIKKYWIKLKGKIYFKIL